MELHHWSRRPLKLKHNRVWRPFVGGLLLDGWQGVENPQDGNLPEEWVASTLEARNLNPAPLEGLSLVEFQDHSTMLLRDIIADDPAAFLGGEHIHKHGNSTALLVKVLDSYSRLMIQVHPDRDFAKNILDSGFGKTEAWYILGGRVINGEEPYVLFGFKPGMTKKKWKDLFEKQDVEGMIKALQKFTVKPGDVFIIEGGIPHAAGSGVFFLEIQEPTDYTMRTERVSPDGRGLPDVQLHQGAGFDKMLDCFHYDSYSREELLDRWYIKPSARCMQEGGKESYLISSADTMYFSMSRIEVESIYRSFKEQVFSVAVVISGEGKVLWDGGEMELKQSDEFFLPAGLSDMVWMCAGGQRLDIVRCYPPG